MHILTVPDLAPDVLAAPARPGQLVEIVFVRPSDLYALAYRLPLVGWRLTPHGVAPVVQDAEGDAFALARDVVLAPAHDGGTFAHRHGPAPDRAVDGTWTARIIEGGR